MVSTPLSGFRTKNRPVLVGTSDLDESLRRNIRETDSLAACACLSTHDGRPILCSRILSGVAERSRTGQALGAALLNIHLYGEAGLGAYLEAITPLVRCAAEAGLQLSIENTP
jgi:hypothetical protein